jgi:hypothetical protein
MNPLGWSLPAKIGTALIALVLGGVVIAYSAYHTTPATSSSAKSLPSFKTFQGVWSRHGSTFSINDDGSFVAEWRTNKLCNDSPPPCDQMVNNIIISGGQASGHLRVISNSSARGSIEASSDATTFTEGTDIVVTLLPYDMMRVDARIGGTTNYCGPNFGVQAPPELVNTKPCGI